MNSTATEPVDVRSQFAEDETGQSIITFRGSIEIEDTQGTITAHARTIRFITTHREDWRLNSVAVLVESPDRPRDTLDVGAPPHLPLSSTLNAMVDYIVEQERRIRTERAQ